MDRETIARVLFDAECTMRTPEFTEHFKGFVPEFSYVLADAILAEIGNPDATGDVMGRDHLQEAIAKAIFEETTSQEQRPGWTEPGQERKVTDLNAKSARVIRRAAGVIVDIVAKSGYDATGDLLMRAAGKYYVLVEGPDAEIPRWKVAMYPDPLKDVVFQAERPTPGDALQAALAAAEEGK